MRYVKLPSIRSLKPASWSLAGLLVAMAFFSPGPDAGALLLTAATTILFARAMLERSQRIRVEADAEKLSRNVAQFQAAEGLAGYGRWCIELDPRRHLWSEEMCRLAGLEPGTAPSEEVLRTILPDGIGQIEMVLEAHAGDREAFVAEFEVLDNGSPARILRARARNVFSPEGVREQVFMVVHDVTGDYALRRDRDEAMERAAVAQHEANTDALTGLANRRHAMAELDRAVMRSHRMAEQLSIVLFDIDHFKQVNDRYGHAVGDKVIAMLGEIVSRQAREMDVVGRIGGEEFLWIMPGCDSQAALRAAERLRWAVEAGTHSAPVPAITISAGHAEITAGDASLSAFSRADAALYEAKRAGRNRVAQAA